MKSLVILALIALTSFTVEENATIVFLRKGLYSGTAGATKIFMDGKMICELSNNSFSTHQVLAGTHKFNALWYSKNAKENLDDIIEIEMKPGQEYYLQTVKQDKGLKAIVALQEITANTWNKTKEGLEEDDCH